MCLCCAVPFLLQYSWKLLHPTNHYDNKECPTTAEDYEKVTHKTLTPRVHTHTSSFLLCTPCPQLDVGRHHDKHQTGLVELAGRCSWWIADRHWALSFTRSSQLVILDRSLLTTSIQRSEVPPGFLFLPRGRHFSTCRCGRWAGILWR